MSHHIGREEQSSCYGPDRMLEGLWVKFVKLQGVRQEVMLDFGVATTASGRSDQSDRLFDGVFAPIADELNRLAHQAALVESKSRVDMEYKAVMLEEYLPESEASLHVALMRSLLKDIRGSN
ncbi:MAG: hypothetical protein JXQ99_16070 [Hyphomicrobiaceae bacterium]